MPINSITEIWQYLGHHKFHRSEQKLSYHKQYVLNIIQIHGHNTLANIHYFYKLLDIEILKTVKFCTLV